MFYCLFVCFLFFTLACLFVGNSKGLVEKHITHLFRSLNSQTPINDHSAQLELKGYYGVFFLKFELCVISYLFCVMMRGSQFREYVAKCVL